MAITRRTLRLQADLDAAIRTITDVQTGDMVRAWATAWDEVSPDLTAVLLEELTAGDKVTRAQLLRSTRLRKALAVIADQLQVLAEKAHIRIVGDLQQVIDTAGAAQASVIDSQLPPGSKLVDLGAWSRVDERQLAAIVERTARQITSRTRPLSREAYAAVRRELIRGVAAGSNPRATAARIVARAEGGFNGGLNRALVIARTETLDAYRAGAQLGQAAHADVLASWTWTSALDSRTCPSCWGMHGSTHPLDEVGPIDHPQGRCARVPTTKSWADLGLDVPEPPSLLPDAQARFAALTADEQRVILGPARHAAYVAGDFPMSSWSVRKSNDGWRDSRHTAPAPRRQSGGRRSPNAA